jgi:zinc protease
MKTLRQITIPFLKTPANWIQYENGYSLFHVPKPGDVFTLSTWVKTGSIHETPDINGVSHFLEHLMFKGTERFKPGEFDKKMESMGAVINAATWKDFTFYYITGPKGTSGQNFESALDMHADMLLHSTLPHEEIGPVYDHEDQDYAGEKRERSVVIEEISMREDQPWTKVYNSLNHMMYPDGHPYQWDVIGTRQIVATIPRENIQDYYRKWYSPQAMTTVVVGDFDLDQLDAQIQKHFDFDTLPPSDGTPMENGPALSTNGKRYAETTGDYQTSFFILGFHGPRPQNLKETIALDVASYVLGEGRSSRLTQELVEKPEKPIFNSLSTGQSTFKLGNVMFIQGNFSHPDTQGTLNLVKEQLEALLTTRPITQEECARALKKLKVDYAETSETTSGIAESIGESITVVGDIAHYIDYLDTLASMDVDTVNAVARQYLDLNKAYTSVLVPNE